MDLVIFNISVQMPAQIRKRILYKSTNSGPQFMYTTLHSHTFPPQCTCYLPLLYPRIVNQADHQILVVHFHILNFHLSWFQCMWVNDVMLSCHMAAMSFTSHFHVLYIFLSFGDISTYRLAYEVISRSCSAAITSSKVSLFKK